MAQQQRRTEASGRSKAVLTFLIADVRGYTRFTAERGDAAAAILAKRFADLARDAVEARGGRVIELRGDEALAVFDSPAQAVRAAVEFQATCAEESEADPTFPLPVGIGIDAGEAVPVEDGYRGVALNMAARLCSNASAGQVLVTRTILSSAEALGAEVMFVERGPVTFKGFEQAVDVIEVAATEAPPPVEPALEQDAERGVPPELDPLTPLVDLEHEMRWLRGTWRQVRRGRGRVVFVSGPTQIGKTRLAGEIAAHVHGGGSAIRYAGPGGAATAMALSAIRAAKGASTPTLLVLDDVDGTGPPVVHELMESFDEFTRRPILVLALLRDSGGAVDLSTVIDRANERGDGHRVLVPLDTDGVRAIVRLYVGDGEAETPIESMFRASQGVPGRVHEVVAEWARTEASRRLAAAAEFLAAGRDRHASDLEFANNVIGLKLGRLFAVEGDQVLSVQSCPYKGLAQFEEDDSAFFFGRERLVGELAARTVQVGLLGVVGASGSGKSSVIGAGLLPSLRAGLLPGSEQWRQASMRPGEHPVSELRAVLSNQEDDPLVATIANVPEGPRLVLVVDQFEETFTTCADERERAAFIDMLTHAASRWPERVVVIVAIRGDYYADCARYPELAEALAANHGLVGPLNGEELRRAIELPARRTGLRVEAALTDALVEEVADEPGGLPLLSTALVELWQAREDGWVRMEVFERTGGVRGAVARLAESSYEQLSDAQREAARRVFLRLVASGEGEAVTRRRISLEEFDLDRDAAAAGVLARLTQDRLLTMGEDTVEVAHEALLREWPRLQQWLREDAQGRELRHHLTQAARQWQARNRDRAELYRGARRSSALEWSATHEQELNKLERDFLAASRHAGERAIRRLQAGIATLAVLLVIAVGAGVFALHESTASRRQALLATGRALTEASAANLGVDPERSMLLALKAIDTFRSTSGPVPREAVEALHAAIEADRVELAFHTPASEYVAFSLDGSLAATASGSSPEAVLWDAHTGRRIRTFPKQTGGIGPDLRFSPDGSRLYTHVAGVGIVGWSAPTGRQVLLLQDAGPLSNLALSPDGQRIAAASFDGTLTIWSVSTSRRLLKVSAPTPLCGTSFSPDGTRIAAALCFNGPGATALVWDTHEGRKVLTIGTPTGLGSATFDVAYSPNGGEIATVANDGKGRIWDARTGRLLSTLVGHQGWVFAVKFSPDGRTIATGSSDATARIWDAETGQQLLVLAGHSKTVYDVSFSPDGGRLLTGSTDGTTRIWDLRPQGSRDAVTIPAQGGFKGVLAVGYSPDGRLLVTGGGGSPSAAMWDASTGRRLRILPQAGDVFAAVFSPDGTRILVAGNGEASIIDAGSGRTLLKLPNPEGDLQPDGAWSPDGKVVALALGTGAGAVTAWDSRTGRLVRTFPFPPDGVLALAFSPDGSRLAAGGGGTTGKLWDFASGRVLATLSGHKDTLSSVTFSPDGRRLATTSFDGTVKLWDGRTGKALATIQGTNSGALWDVAFSNDGEHFATADDDGTVKVWDTSSGTELLRLSGATRAVQHVAFSPDGTRLAAGSADGTVRIYILPLNQLMNVARSRLTRSWTPAECREFLHVDRCPPMP